MRCKRKSPGRVWEETLKLKARLLGFIGMFFSSLVLTPYWPFCNRVVTLQECLTPQVCMTPGPLCADARDPRGPASQQTMHLRLWPPLGRRKQSRAETHLTLNAALEPEVPSWLGQAPQKPPLQAQHFPLAPAAAASQILRSCRGSGGWLLGAGNTGAARRGSQGASRVAPGKSGLHARGEAERVLALESREGTRASHSK